MPNTSGWKKVLFTTCIAYVLMSSGNLTADAQIAKYRVDFDVTWSSQTHPGAILPVSHFDSFSGATHSDAVMFWEEGQLATPGVVQEAEFGVSPTLDTELQDAVTAGTAGRFISVPGWVCPAEVSHANCIEPTFMFDIHEDFPLVTLIAMIGPSPDWFVGVSGQSLLEDDQWVEQVTLDLFPYDAGTRSNNDTFDLGGPQNSSPEPISLITNTSSQLIGGASLGTVTFTLVPEPASAFILVLGGLGLIGRRNLCVFA